MSAILKAFAVLALALAFVSCAKKPEYPTATISSNQVRIPLSSLREGTPVFYTLKHDDARVDYFVLRINGRVESYFDACAKCYPKKKGYRTEGSEMVCVACGQRFPMDGLKGIGSCHPLQLEGAIEGDAYAIDENELLKGAKSF